MSLASVDGPGQDRSLAETTPTVFCVVLNWNGWQDTIPCLHALAAQDYPALRVLVVDNASTDDSVERIREAFPAIELLQAEGNRGFSSGCNIGTRLALDRGASFVWLLNNDTVAPADTLTRLVNAAFCPQTGVVGTVLRYQHNPAEVQAWGGGSILGWIGFGTHFRAPAPLGPNSFLTFASVLLRRELLQTTGLLDEGFFMYFEDSDLCFRARSDGWRLVVAADTAVLHKEGGSSNGKPSPLRQRIFTASGLRFLGRHGSPRVLALLLFPLSRLFNRVFHGDFAGARAVLLGVRDWRRDQPLAFQAER